MKNTSHTIRKFLAILGLMFALLPIAVLADPPPPAGAPPAAGGTGGTSPAGSKDASVTPDELFYNFTYKGASATSMTTTNIGAVNAIYSNQSWQMVLANIIKMLLNVSGGLALIGLTVGGVYMVTARGKPDVFDKAKKILVFSITGLIVISISYALVIGVSNLQFFTPGAGGVTQGAGGGAPGAPTSPGGSSAPGAGAQAPTGSVPPG